LDWTGFFSFQSQEGAEMSEEKIYLGAYEGEQVLEMDIDRLRDFRNHPFKINHR
jgi:hypothetical protein